MKKITISPAFCAMVCILAWLDLTVGLCLLMGMIVHEMGHLIFMMVFHVPIYGVVLSLAGAQIKSGPMNHAKEALCALMGPLFNVILGAAVLRNCPEFSIINVCLAAVNLLPLYPLDGGRILLCVLRSYLSEERANSVIKITNAVLCIVLMVGACWVAISLQAGLWPIFTALVLLWRAGNQETYCISEKGRIK